MQMAVTAISDMNKRVRGGAAGAKEDWLDTVNKNLEQEQKVRSQSYVFIYVNSAIHSHANQKD